MRTLFWILAVLTLVGAAAAAAQPPETTCRLVQGRGGRREVVCEPITIEGSAPRPTVVLGRTRDRYDAPPLERDLAREIERTVRHAPF